MSDKRKRDSGALLILLAGCFWGSMGLFVRRLEEYGFSSIQIVAIRLTLGALVFCLLLRLQGKEGFRIAARDIPLFLVLSLGSLLFLAVCYFKAISLLSLSTAAVLLYTSPIWIMLMSVLFFREKLSGRKLLALVLAFGGCVLVSGLSGGGVTPLALLIGLGAGLGYGLYSILATVALRRYPPLTVTAYTFLFAAVGSWAICRPGEMAAFFAAAERPAALAGLCALTALVTAVIPFLTYTLGLRTVEASRAGILATVEPLVATLFGVFVFHEPLTPLSALGIALILAAVVLLNRK